MNRSKKALGLCLLSVVLCIVLLGAKAPVKHTSELYVNDYAGVVSAADKERILAVGRQLEEQTGAQVAVLTVNSLEGEDIAAYAHQVAEGWKLGKAGEDNGVLLVLSTGERLSRIEVGYGLEGTLTDILTGRIQDDYMLPHFREDDYSTGLRQGYDAVASSIYRHYNLEVPETLPVVGEETAVQSGLGMLAMLVLLVVVFGGRAGLLPLFFLGGRRGGGRPGGGASFGGGGRFGGGGSSRRF